MLELFILFLVLMYIAVPDASVLGVSIDCVYNCLFYQFVHANFLHLFMNSLSLLIMARPIWYLYTLKFGHISFSRFLLYSYIGSVLAALVSLFNIPTVGASGMVYFMLGVLLAVRPTLAQLKGFFWVFACIIAQLIFGKSNVVLHIAAFLIGIIFVSIKTICQNRNLNLTKG